MELSTSGLKAGSLFKFLWLGNAFGLLPLFILAGVAAIFGAGTVTAVAHDFRTAGRAG